MNIISILHKYGQNIYSICFLKIISSCLFNLKIKYLKFEFYIKTGIYIKRPLSLDYNYGKTIPIKVSSLSYFIFILTKF